MHRKVIVIPPCQEEIERTRLYLLKPKRVADAAFYLSKHRDEGKRDTIREWKTLLGKAREGCFRGFLASITDVPLGPIDYEDRDGGDGGVDFTFDGRFLVHCLSFTWLPYTSWVRTANQWDKLCNSLDRNRNLFALLSDSLDDFTSYLYAFVSFATLDKYLLYPPIGNLSNKICCFYDRPPERYMGPYADKLDSWNLTPPLKCLQDEATLFPENFLKKVPETSIIDVSSIQRTSAGVSKQRLALETLSEQVKVISKKTALSEAERTFMRYLSMDRLEKELALVSIEKSGYGDVGRVGLENRSV